MVVINDLRETEDILGALRKGGINCAEITFRTPCAKEAIRLGRMAFPDMNVGAGTVVNDQQCVDAIDAGVKFIVSPDCRKTWQKYAGIMESLIFPAV